jgi:uncharacterized protein
MKSDQFVARYGPWALVAGGSDGLGMAFSMFLAQLGLNVVIVARRKAVLAEAACSITKKHPVQVRTIEADLGDSESRDRLFLSTQDIDVGLLVYNAAVIPIGRFLDIPAEKHAAAIETNCMGPVSLVHHFANRMSARGKGGIILMSSMSALQGTPLVSTYGATKSFNLILAESIGYELSASGIDVLACAAGPTLTPNYISTKPDSSRRPPTMEMTPEDVVAETLNSLGSRRVLIPGKLNRFFSLIMSRLLSRKQAVSLIGKNMYRLYGPVSEK